MRYDSEVMTDDFYQLQPSMIAAKWEAFGEEAKRCKAAGVRMLHLDVMDGQFVKNLTMGPDMVKAMKKVVPDLVLDVHLMIYSPEEYIERFIEAGADEVTFHLEATEDVFYNLDYIQKSNKKAGIAIKPDTSETLLLKFLEQVDKILIMTVEPGFGGQPFMENMLDKVKFIRQKAEEIGRKIDIQVDGGVTLETGKRCIAAGANRLVAGTFFFKQDDLGKAHCDFKSLFESATGR